MVNYHKVALEEQRKREPQIEEQFSARNSGEHKIHKKRTKSFHSRVQPAGRDSRDVCSAAQMSAEVRLYSEGCRGRIGRTDVKNECVSRKEPEQTISGVRSFGGMFSQLVHSSETEGGSPRTKL